MTDNNAALANDTLRRELDELSSGNPKSLSSKELTRRADRMFEIFTIIEDRKAALLAELKKRGEL